MAILVTGATGFIGSELVRQLIAQGEEVRILRRASSTLDLLADVETQVTHIIGDVTDPDILLEAMEGIEQVYHAAAFVGFGGKADREKLIQVNVGGTANVVNAALKMNVKRLVHTSSMAAFGRPTDTDRISEKTQWQNANHNSGYAYSKYRSELEIHRGIAEGLDAVMVNPALVFGKGRKNDNTMQIVERVIRRKIPAVPSGGTNVVDVRDVVQGHLLAMEKGKTGERYFLGSENLSWDELITIIATAFGVAPVKRKVSKKVALGIATVMESVAKLTRTKPVITRETVRTANMRYYYDNTKAKTALGVTFRTFQETMQDLAASWE